MVTHTYEHLEIEEARYLANLFGIEYDLRSTINWCKKFDSLFADKELGWLIEPITVAILINFIRAFGGGVRNRNALHLLKLLNDGQKKQYEYFKNVRDKHIAHSVNEFETNYVKACYIEENPKEGIKSIGLGSTRVIALSSNEINEIENICTTLLQGLKKEIETEKVNLLKFTKKNYTVEDIKKMKICVPKHTKDINVSRKRK
jgi:hypothetical protein